MPNPNDSHRDRLLWVVDGLKHALLLLLEGQEQCATKQDLHATEQRIMSAIADFAAKQKAFNDRQGAAVDAAVTSITAIQGDLKTLNDKITELQNSPGAITPEDQALLDQLDAQGEAVSTKVEAAAAALSNLDAMTPPAPPVG